MAFLSRIYIYPIKSLEATRASSARVLTSGAIDGDRRFAIVDEHGLYVNGKRNAHVHLLRSHYTPETRQLTLSDGSGPSATFDVDVERVPLENWLSTFFGIPVTFRENLDEGFPDDLESPGPTVIATATLQAIADWFDLSLDDVRARFRANLEIGGVPPFWEDRLYGPRGTTMAFKIGGVLFHGINPCQRCIVPARNQKTGENIPDFAKRFVEMRKKFFPEWAEETRFNHYYRVAINTRLAEGQTELTVKVGDPIEIVGLTGTPTAPSPPTVSRPERWTGALRILGKFDNTPTVTTFRLGTDDAELPFTYLPGQFLNVEMPIDDVVQRRCYTISSSPTQKRYCEITIKREESGVVSRHMHDCMKAGDTLTVFGPGGKFTFDEDEAECLLLIGAGVGITPLMSKIRYLTEKRWGGEIRLLFCARSEEDLIFRDELEALETTAANFTYIPTLTKELSPNWQGLRGRIDCGLLRKSLPSTGSVSVHFCGPVAMAHDIETMLVEIGVPAARFHSESFGGAMPKSTSTGGPEIGVVTFGDSGKSLPVRSGQTVLEVATAAGVPLDRGCLEGICGRCRVRLLSGSVELGVDEALSLADRSDGFILACQAKPLGSIAVDA